MQTIVVIPPWGCGRFTHRFGHSPTLMCKITPQGGIYNLLPRQYHCTRCYVGNGLLGRAWASPTLAWLHCARMCTSDYLSMDRPHTVNFKWAYLNISWNPSCTCMQYAQLTVARRWRATARAQRQREGSPRNEDDTRMATADHDRQGQAAHSTNHAL